jgi:1,4-alpha-glucan branching enzyme
MRKLLLLLLLFPVCSWAQSVSVTPTITPTLFRYNDQITVSYDVTGTALAGLANAWAWVWIPGATIDAKYNVNPANSNTTLTNNAKFVKTTPAGRVVFTITFKPSDFFAQDISTKTKMGILLKGNDWSNGQTTDYLADLWDGSFQVALTSPSQRPLFVDNGENITIAAETPIAANYVLKVNGSTVNTQNNVTSFNYVHTVTETSGGATVDLLVTKDAASDQVSFQYIVSSNSPVQARPAGIIQGINYHSGDNTKVTLCLLAPGKNSVYVRGDFSDWGVLAENIMKKDGELFWLEIDGLTAGEEYAYQYLVDENLWLADPYSDKILDPDDEFIPDDTYPDLKIFPTEAKNVDNKWYFNRLSVFQTGQTPYNWQVPAFEKPAKTELVVYELLIRDFFDDGDNHYQSLIDTISYFKRLGVNAIELMPIMEFGGNNSWGYNPQFMFAPDKAYGPKNKFKKFIDVCHQNGIAVILDIAMNHQDMPNPFLLQDFDFASNPMKPKPSNRWFNVTATHPFSVFFDMNHESQYTKDYLDTINYYWLHEYKIDGYRFDLSKGFTQVNNPNDVNAWSNYDASRIAILKRMADRIWDNFPDAYVILEHLSVNAEEKELAEYRSGEGKGMMLWGNINEGYLESSMGYAAKSNISHAYYVNRGWTVPHLVSYMESHDEERMIYKNVQFGNAAGNYSVKQLNTALDRAKAAATIFYTIPGPKMLWQFGELGYDYSINYCEDTGTIDDDCRTYPKPVEWEYQDVASRGRLYNHISDLLRMRDEYDVFTSGTATLPSSAELTKQLIVKNNPYTATPANAADMNAIVLVNFDVIEKSITVNYPHTGLWYDYYARGTSLNAATNTSITLQPGEFKLLTDVQIENQLVVGTENELISSVSVYPNPVGNILRVESETEIIDLKIHSLHGVTHHPKRSSSDVWDISELREGMYVVEIRTRSGNHKVKIVKSNSIKN